MTHPDVIKALEGLLADTALVYYKTHGFHWNVESPDFYGLHLMFEKFYTEVWESLDEIAERLRAVGGKAPASLKLLLEKATLKETDAAPTDSVMVEMLKIDYQDLAKKTREVAAFVKSKGDEVTENMLLEKATFLEKAAWMLRSTIKCQCAVRG